MVCFAKYLNFAKIKAIMYFAKFLNAFVRPRGLDFSRGGLYIRSLQITRFEVMCGVFVFWGFGVFSGFRGWPEFRLFRGGCS